MSKSDGTGATAATATTGGPHGSAAFVSLQNLILQALGLISGPTPPDGSFLMTTKPNTPEPGATDETFNPTAANDAGSAPPENQAPDAGLEPDRVAQLEAERADFKEKLLRTLADMENLRRRTEREIADARTYAVSNFARDMLTVADNFQRAIDSVPAEARAAGEPALKALIEGVELTERDMLKTLERYGVKRINPEGQKFDPNLHQAMFEVPNPNVPNGTVIQVVQTGYVIGDRVLRPALVGVAKGGPKASAQDQASDETTGGTGEPAAAGNGQG
jgi:molecular chaperone GrpE